MTESPTLRPSSPQMEVELQSKPEGPRRIYTKLNSIESRKKGIVKNIKCHSTWDVSQVRSKVYFREFRHVSSVSCVTLQKVSCECYLYSERVKADMSDYCRVFPAKHTTPSADHRERARTLRQYYLKLILGHQPKISELYDSEVSELFCFCEGSICAHTGSLLSYVENDLSSFGQ